MSNATFPALPGLLWDIQKSPRWNSRVQQSVGGYETRIAFQSLPLWTWTLKFEFLRGSSAYAEFQQLAEFFNARQGSYDSFLYSDPSDNIVADTNSTTRQTFGTGTGARTQWQLGRSLTVGGLLEPIYNTNSTPKIYIDNVLKTAGADYTISAGLVTFSSAPANGAVLKWSGTYYWRVRFVADVANFSEFVQDYWELSELSFSSVLGS
jgi:uncharacterized protein (TIGR02217 family)